MDYRRRDPHAQMDPNYPHYDRRVSPFGHHSPVHGEDFSSASSSSRIESHQPMPATYRGSNTPDEMEQQAFAYGHHMGVTSSLSSTSVLAPTSMGQFSGAPMESLAQEVKLTPVTGKVSKALKGVPVHTCHDCVPPRVSCHIVSPGSFPCG